MVERAQQIASYVAKHLSSLSARMKSPQHMEALKEFSSKANGDTVMSFLEGIHVMRVHDHSEQLAAVANLNNLIQKHPKGKRCVLSFSFFFLFIDIRPYICKL